MIGFLSYETFFSPEPLPNRELKILVPGLPSGSYVVKPVRVLYPDDKSRDRLHDTALSREPDWPLTVTAAPPTIPVHAFYNRYARHYFLTASAAEREGILRGDAGSDDYWFVADNGFNAWPADGPAPIAAQPVCRFYSSSANSHFYVVDGEECAQLKTEDSGWTYEGIGFRALMATAGSCPPGTDPVWRLYNNRAAQNDSNHRFTTSTASYQSMIAQGWIGEGAAFCSPR